MLIDNKLFDNADTLKSQIVQLEIQTLQMRQVNDVYKTLQNVLHVCVNVPQLIPDCVNIMMF